MTVAFLYCSFSLCLIQLVSLIVKLQKQKISPTLLLESNKTSENEDTPTQENENAEEAKKLHGR